MLACSVCGEPVRGARRAGADRYVCPAGHVSIMAAEVDPWVDALAVERLTRPDLIGLLDQADPGAASAARAEAARHRAKIADAAASYAADKIDLAALEAITATFRPLAEAAERRARDAETPSALVGLPDTSRAVAARRWAVADGARPQGGAAHPRPGCGDPAGAARCEPGPGGRARHPVAGWRRARCRARRWLTSAPQAVRTGWRQPRTRRNPAGRAQNLVACPCGQPGNPFPAVRSRTSPSMGTSPDPPP